MLTSWTEITERIPAQRTVGGRLAVESGLVMAGVAVVESVVGWVSAVLVVDELHAHFVLAILAAGAGTAAVGLGHTAGRIAGNRRAAWLIPALALYSVVVVPSTAVPGAHTKPSPVVLVGSLCVAVLLLVAIRPPGRVGAGAGWLAAVAGTAVALALAAVDGAVPDATPVLSSRTSVNVVLLLGWCVVSLAVVVAGYYTSSPPLWRIGLGFGVIATAHLYRALRPQPIMQPSLIFAGLRLFGVVVVLLGMAQLLRRCLARVISESFGHQEELRLACLRVQELAQSATEREHELRNGLAGLTGITQLLGTRADDPHTHRAREAVARELRRLSELLDQGRSHDRPVEYCASEVVEGLVALWRAAGMDIACSMPPGLTVAGRPSALAQALTNVFTNCARHAAGAPVRIEGNRVGGRVVVEVNNDRTDDGDRRGGARGQGIGLPISRRLLRAEHADLRVHPADDLRPGYTVSMILRAGGDGTRADDGVLV
jgi:two-component system, OmpR family, sensor kinase